MKIGKIHCLVLFNVLKRRQHPEKSKVLGSTHRLRRAQTCTTRETTKSNQMAYFFDQTNIVGLFFIVSSLYFLWSSHKQFDHILVGLHLSMPSQTKVFTACHCLCWLLHLIGNRKYIWSSIIISKGKRYFIFFYKILS